MEFDDASGRGGVAQAVTDVAVAAQVFADMEGRDVEVNGFKDGLLARLEHIVGDAQMKETVLLWEAWSIMNFLRVTDASKLNNLLDRDREQLTGRITTQERWVFRSGCAVEHGAVLISGMSMANGDCTQLVNVCSLAPR